MKFSPRPPLLALICSLALPLVSQAAISIVSQPSGVNAAPNAPITLNVVAQSDVAGATLRYQWLKDGEAISGATSFSLNIGPAKPWHIGDYAVAIEELNLFGVPTGQTALSNAATLAVIGIDSSLWRGLIGYYDFSAGSTNDLTVMANHLNNTAATPIADRFNRANRAYAFDATNNAFMVSQQNLPIADDDSRTFAFWMRTHTVIPAVAPAKNWMILSTGSDLFLRASFDLLMPNDARLQINNSGERTIANTPTASGPSDWIYVTVTNQGSSDTSAIFINGVKVANTPEAIFSLASTAGRLRISANRNNGTLVGAGFDRFDGVLDDIRVYNRALSDSEANALFLAQSAAPSLPAAVPNPASGLVAAGNRLVLTPPNYVPVNAGASVEYIWQRFNLGTASWVGIGSPTFTTTAPLTIASTSAALHSTQFRYVVREDGDDSQTYIAEPLSITVMNPVVISAQPSTSLTAGGLTLNPATGTDFNLRASILESASLPITFTWEKRTASGAFVAVPDADLLSLPNCSTTDGSTIVTCSDSAALAKLRTNMVLKGSGLLDNSRVVSIDTVAGSFVLNLAANATGTATLTVDSAGILTGRAPGDSGNYSLLLPLVNIPIGPAPTYRLTVTNPVTSKPVVSTAATIVLNSPPYLLPGKDVNGGQATLVLTEGGSGRLSISPSGNGPFFYRWRKVGSTAGPNIITTALASSLSIRATLNNASGVAEGPGQYQVEVFNRFSTNPAMSATSTRDQILADPSFVPLLSTAVQVLVIRRPSLSAAAPTLSSPLPLIEGRVLNYTGTLPEAVPANRNRISVALNNGTADVNYGNYTVSWQRNSLTLVSTSTLSAQAEIGSTTLLLPSTAGLVVGMKVYLADPAAPNPFPALNPADPLDDSFITRISGRVITLSAATTTAAITAGTRLLFKNRSNKLPALLADHVDAVSEVSASNPKLILDPLSHLEAWNLRGAYRALIGNETGSVTSGSLNVDCLTPPLITATLPNPQTAPDSGQVTVFAPLGGRVTLSIATAGTPRLTQAWTRQGSATVLGTGTSLSLSALKAEQEGVYTVTLNNPATSAPFSVAAKTCSFRVQVDQAPRLTTGKIEVLPANLIDQPTSKILVTGTNELILQVKFTGTNLLADADGRLANPMLVTWLRDGVPLNPSFGSILPDSTGWIARFQKVIDFPDTGNYTCVISNGSGTARTSALAIVAGGPPVITGQPQFLDALGNTINTVMVDGSITSTPVRASGYGALKYQWFTLATVAGVPQKVAIAGQTSAQLRITNAAPRVNTSYVCEVSNIFGTSAQTVPIVLSTTPLPAPTLRTAPNIGMYPTVARASEKVQVLGTGFSYLRRVYMDRDNSGSFNTGDISVPFVIESDSAALLTIPATAPLSSTSMRLEVSSRNDYTGPGVGGGTAVTPNFRRTEVYENNLPNSTIIPTLFSRNVIRGDSTEMFRSFGVSTNISASYVVRVPRRSRVIVLVEGESFTSDIINATGQSDFDLQVLGKAPDQSITTGFTLGPDGVTKFSTNPSTVNSPGQGTDISDVRDTGTTSSMELLIRVGPPAFYIDGVTLPHGPFTMTIITDAPLLTTPGGGTIGASPTVSASPASEWEGGALMESDPFSGEAAISLGGDSSQSTSLWRSQSQEPVNSGSVSYQMRLALSGSNGGDDQFGWQLLNASGAASAALWIAADGSLRLVNQAGEVQLSNLRLVAGDANWQSLSLEANLSQSTLRVLLDGVAISPAITLPSGTAISDLQAIWDWGTDGKAGGSRMSISGFQSVVNP